MACNKLKKVKVKIYVVSDKKINKKFKNTIFKSVGKINMSQKRNIAVSIANNKYIAFLDSDCYPSDNWLINAINALCIFRKEFPLMLPETSAIIVMAVFSIRKRSFFSICGFIKP